MTDTGRRLALVLLALGGAVGCTTTVVPPLSPENPVPVFISDHGRHASLLMPVPGGLIEYAYGEWDWFANNRSSWWRTPAVMLWPTRGTLGRRSWSGAGTPESVAGHIPAEAMHRLFVPRARLDALLARLDAWYRRHADTLVYNPMHSLGFVAVDESFSLWNNCNTLVAEWLVELGCEVGSVAWSADYEVLAPGS